MVVAPAWGRSAGRELVIGATTGSDAQETAIAAGAVGSIYLFMRSLTTVQAAIVHMGVGEGTLAVWK